MVKKHVMALVSMPFTDASIPSIQLGVLAGLVRAAGWEARTFHFNLDLAAKIPTVYAELCELDDEFIGDWLFADAAFGESRRVPVDAYLDRFTRDPETGDKDEVLKEYLQNLQKVVMPRFIEDCLIELERGEFDAVGFTSVFQQNVAALALARRLKQRRPELVTVFGGANVHGDMGVAYLDAFPFIDYVALGEAEKCVEPLLQAIASGTRAINVPGIAARTETGAVAARMPQPIEDLSSVPIPDYDEFFARRRMLGLPSTALTLPLETSRGCWWGELSHCIFCGLNGNDMRFRTKSESAVFHELAHLSERYGAYSFSVTDNIMPRQYVDRLFPRLKGGPFRFFYEVKANLTLPQLRIMRDGGVRRILPGIESLSTDILRLLRKGATKLHNIRLLIAARALRVNVSWYLLHGVPGETEQMYQDQAATLRLLGHLEPPARCARIRMDRFSPLFQGREGPSVAWSRPWTAYSSIYPPEVDLNRAAYFFEYDSPQTLSEAFHEQTYKLVETWQAGWARQAPSLQSTRRGDSIVVEDSRFEGDLRVHTFGPDAARVLEACTDIRSLDIVSELADDACLAKLFELGLLIQDRRQVLSLVLPAASAFAEESDTAKPHQHHRARTKFPRVVLFREPQ